MRFLLPIFFILVLGVTTMKPVSAFTKGACLADEEKYCKNAPSENDGKKKCMKEHFDKLSDACKANILEMAVEKKEKQAGGK